MRGEWIEMLYTVGLYLLIDSLSPCGESGLKFQAKMTLEYPACLSPCGESGLKYMPFVS